MIKKPNKQYNLNSMNFKTKIKFKVYKKNQNPKIMNLKYYNKKTRMIKIPKKQNNLSSKNLNKKFKFKVYKKNQNPKIMK